MVSDFDPSEPKTWLTYLDMNNLYMYVDGPAREGLCLV